MEWIILISIYSVILFLFFFFFGYRRPVIRNETLVNSFKTFQTIQNKRYILIKELCFEMNKTFKSNRNISYSIVSLIDKSRTNSDDIERLITIENQISENFNKLLISTEKEKQTLIENNNLVETYKRFRFIDEQMIALKHSINRIIKKHNKVIKQFPSNIFVQLLKINKISTFSTIKINHL